MRYVSLLRQVENTDKYNLIYYMIKQQESHETFAISSITLYAKILFTKTSKGSWELIQNMTLISYILSDKTYCIVSGLPPHKKKIN